MREGKLQHFLRDLKKTGPWDQEVYDAKYLSGWQPTRIYMYGLPKIHNGGQPMPRPLFIWLALPSEQFGQIFE